MSDDERSDAASTCALVGCWKVRPKGESYWLYLRPEDLKDLPDYLGGIEVGDTYELEMFMATPEEIASWPEFDGW